MHVAAGATFGQWWIELNLTGDGIEDDCTLGPHRSTPLCVEPTGTVTSDLGGSYAPADPSRAVAIGLDVTYDRFLLNNGGTFVLGTRAGQTLRATSHFILLTGSLNSDPWHPDVDVRSLYMDSGWWRGNGAFDITVDAEFSGNAAIDLPRADVTFRGDLAYGSIGADFGSDWRLGSMTVLGNQERGNYGTAGHVSYDSGGADTPVGIAIDRWGSDQFVLFNRDGGGTGQDWAVRKYDAAGTLDTGFGSAGEALLAVADVDVATSIIRADDGGVLVAGSVGGNWTVKKLNPNTGALEPSFATGGVWTPGIVGTPTSMTTLRDNGNEIFIAGQGAGNVWEVRRVSATGTTLDSFSWNGDSGGGALPATVGAICAQPDADRMFVVGSVGSGGSRDWAIGKLERVAGTWGWQPFLDGGSRPAPYPAGTAEDDATTCTSPGYFVYVGGTTGDGAAADVGAVRRFRTADGYEEPGWGSGTLTTIDGTGRDYLTRLVGRGLHVWAIGGDSAGGGRTTIRALDWDGKIDGSYGGGAGLVSWDSSPGAERGVAAGLWNERLMVLSSSATGSGDFDVQMLNPTGELQDAWSIPTVTRYSLLGRRPSRITTTGDVRIGDGAGPGLPVMLDLQQMDGALDVGGDLIVDGTEGQLRASTKLPLIVRGNVDLSGEFWHEDGEFRLAPRERRTTFEVAPSTVFNDLRIDSRRAAGTVLLDSANDIDVTGTFTARGMSCTDPLRLRPIGATWTVTTSGGGAVGATSNLDVADATFSPAASIADSWDAGGNTGITFSAPCGSAGIPLPPDAFRTNGIRHATGVVDTPAPTLSWTNNTASAVDLANVVVRSSSSEGVEALYRFEAGSTVADSSAHGRDLVWEDSSAGSGRFGDGRDISDSQDASLTPAFDLDDETFTLEAWFKRDPLTGADTDYPTIFNRDGGGAFKTFFLGFDRDQNTLLFNFSKGGGTDWYGAGVPAAAYTDGTWHHVAATYDHGVARLFVDGRYVDGVYSGTAPIDTGLWPTIVGWRFNGSLDDAQIRSVAASAGEIAGYYRTGRQHLDDVWSVTGAPMSVADGALASLTYGGAAGTLAHEGARYWTSAQLRTDPGGAWSSWSDGDWFETTIEGQTSVSLPDGSDLPLGVMLPGQDAHGEFRVRVTTTNEHGWTLQALGEDDSYALSDGRSGVDHRIARRTVPTWNAGVGGFAGLTVLDAPGGKTSPWCGDANPANYAAQCYAWPQASSSMTIHRVDGYDTSPQDVDLSVRVNPSATTTAGEYTGRLSFIVLPNV